MPLPIGFTASPVRAAQLATGWYTIPLGAGGFITGLAMSDDGTSKLIRTDTYGFYRQSGSAWIQAMDRANFSSVTTPSGCYEVAVAPSDPNLMFVYIGEGSNSSIPAILYKSENGGVTWREPNGGRFSISGNNQSLVNDTTNGYKFCQRKVVVDPNNPAVIYAGCPAGSQTGKTGVYRSIDRGENWTQISTSDIPAPTTTPGVAGICFVRASGTVTGVGGLTVTKTILVPSGGNGVYRSTDGGLTWVSISTPATPDTTISITTSTADTLVMVQLAEQGSTTGISNTGTASLTWNNQINNFAQGGAIFWSQYWARATSSGTYNITVTHANGGNGTNAVVFALKNADFSTPPTSLFFTGSPDVKAAFAGTATVTSTGAGFVTIAVQGTGPVVDSGFSQLSTLGIWQEYQVNAPAATYNQTGGTSVGANTYFGGFVNVIKGGTVDLDGAVVTSTSGPSVGPTRIWDQQVDYEGTAFCNHLNSQIYRLSINSTSYELLTGFGSGVPLQNFQGGAAGGAVCVDPRQAFVGTVTLQGGQNIYCGRQSVNAASSTARNDILWRRAVTATGGFSQTLTGDVGWIVAQQGGAGGPAPSDMQINTVDGKYWCANGVGLNTFPGPGQTNALNYQQDAPFTYNVRPDYFCNGIEQLVAVGALSPVGATQPIFAVQDRTVMRTANVTSPTGYPPVFSPGVQSNCKQIDWASANPAFVVAVIPDGANGSHASGYSSNYGQTFTIYTKEPAFGVGGCIAALSSNSQIAMVGSTPTAGAQPVRYTTDCGATSPSSVWATSNLSYVAFGNPNYRVRCLAADRFQANTYYAYVPSPSLNSSAIQGLWRSTDAGQTFTRVNSNAFAQDWQYAYQMATSPCQSISGNNWSDILFTANLGDGLYVSQDKGATFNKIPNTSNTVVSGWGQAKPGGNGYCSIYMYGAVSGVSAAWRLDNWDGGPGGTWFNMGTVANFPVSCQLDFLQSIDGDMNLFGRCYVMENGSGGTWYNP